MYETGTVLAGKYRIERRLGRGGMGLVLAAEHIELRTAVAVKCLHDAYTRRGDVVQRFLREARASAQLKSDHVCRVFDVGRLDTGTPYFVMELLHGRDLAKLLRASGPLDVRTATAYVLQACDAIQEAHAARIIHRDLKPGNLFLTQRRDGSPLIKVLDFGVAKAPDEGDFTLTGTETVVGSPAYMAPEQIRASKIADERSDIWSLGVVLYELVSGQQPFRSTSIGDLAIRIATEPVEPLRSAPIGFALIVARCLEKDTAKRFQSVGELAHALATCVEPPPVTVQPSAGRVAPPAETLMTSPALEPPVSTTLRGASGALSPHGLRRARLGLVSTVVAGALIGVGLVVMLGPRSRGGAGDRATPGATAHPPPPDPAVHAPVVAPAPSEYTSTPPAPAPTTTEPAPASAAAAPNEPLATEAYAPPIDAGVARLTKPIPDEDRPHRPPAPVRRPVRPKTKDQIGESRI